MTFQTKPDIALSLIERALKTEFPKRLYLRTELMVPTESSAMVCVIQDWIMQWNSAGYQSAADSK